MAHAFQLQGLALGSCPSDPLARPGTEVQAVPGSGGTREGRAHSQRSADQAMLGSAPTP